MIRLAEHLIYGVDGPVVVMSSRVCALLDRLLGVDKLRSSELREQDPEFYQALLAMRLAALARAESSSVGTKSAPQREPVRQSRSQENETVSTTTAAEVLGIGRRAVNRAITDKRLAATKDDGGRYRITQDELRRFAAERLGREPI